MKLHLCLTGTLLLARLCVPAQSLDSTLDKISNFPNRLFAKIQSKEASLDQMLTRQTEKYLEKLAANERKLHNKLAEKDSAAAKNNFAGIQEKYLKYEQEIKSIEAMRRSHSAVNTCHM